VYSNAFLWESRWSFPAGGADGEMRAGGVSSGGARGTEKWWSKVEGNWKRLGLVTFRGSADTPYLAECLSL
jgi:hypothetical protein